MAVATTCNTCGAIWDEEKNTCPRCTKRGSGCGDVVLMLVAFLFLSWACS